MHLLRRRMDSNAAAAAGCYPPECWLRTTTEIVWFKKFLFVTLPMCVCIQYISTWWVCRALFFIS